jgi:hypothetical protein
MSYRANLSNCSTSSIVEVNNISFSKLKIST